MNKEDRLTLSLVLSLNALNLRTLMKVPYMPHQQIPPTEGLPSTSSVGCTVRYWACIQEWNGTMPARVPEQVFLSRESPGAVREGAGVYVAVGVGVLSSKC